jgi:hypothetical protein
MVERRKWCKVCGLLPSPCRRSLSMPSLPLHAVAPSPRIMRAILGRKTCPCRLSHLHAVHGDAPRAGSALLVLTPYSRCAHNAPRAGNARALRRPQPRAPGLGAGARLLAHPALCLNLGIDAFTARLLHVLPVLRLSHVQPVLCLLHVQPICVRLLHEQPILRLWHAQAKLMYNLYCARRMYCLDPIHQQCTCP